MIDCCTTQTCPHLDRPLKYRLTINQREIYHPGVQVIFITTDGFLGAEGKVREDLLVENAAGMVRDGANDLAIQFRVRDAGETLYGIDRGKGGHGIGGVPLILLCRVCS